MSYLIEKDNIDMFTINWEWFSGWEKDNQSKIKINTKGLAHIMPLVTIKSVITKS